MTGNRLNERIRAAAPGDADGRAAEPGPVPAAGRDWTDVSLADRFLKPRTLISFAVAFGVVLLALSRLDVDPNALLTEMRNANPVYLGVAFAAYYGAFGFRAARWRSLLESADIRSSTGSPLPGVGGLAVIFVISWFANCIVPAKLGDAYRGFLLKRRAQTSFTGALGTIFAERLVDLLALSTILVISGFLVFGRHLPGRITSWILLAVGLGVAVAAVVTLAVRFRARLRGLVPTRVRDHYVRLEEGAMGSFGRVPTLIALTAVIWLMEGVRLYFVGLAVGASLTIVGAVFVALLASLLTVIPFTPAGLGFVEVGVVGTLALLGTADQTAASVALLDRLVAYWSVILIGGLVYLVARWRWR